MAFTELFVETPGQTNLYAFPASASYALATWATHRVLASEVQTGLYSVTCDDAKSTKWLVFVGATQPANMNEAIYELTKPVSIPALTGARTVTITVQLASANVEGATVRISKAGDSDTKITNASGQVVFSVDDGTWTVAITKSGMSFTPVSLVVDGNETVTYSMTAVSIPGAGSPGLCVVRVPVVDLQGDPLAGCNVSVWLEDANPTIDSALVSRVIYSAVTNVSGYADLTLIQFASFVSGGIYNLKVSDPNGKLLHQRRVKVPTVSSCYVDDLDPA